MSANVKHTPGPWISKGRGVYKTVPIPGHYDKGVQRKGNHFECSVSSGNRLASDEELEANARLMAASPDLLAACHTALTYIERYTDQTDYQRRKLRAAIKKAGGEL